MELTPATNKVYTPITQNFSVLNNCNDLQEKKFNEPFAMVDNSLLDSHKLYKLPLSAFRLYCVFKYVTHFSEKITSLCKEALEFFDITPRVARKYMPFLENQGLIKKDGNSYCLVENIQQNGKNKHFTKIPLRLFCVWAKTKCKSAMLDLYLYRLTHGFGKLSCILTKKTIAKNFAICYRAAGDLVAKAVKRGSIERKQCKRSSGNTFTMKTLHEIAPLEKFGKTAFKAVKALLIRSLKKNRKNKFVLEIAPIKRLLFIKESLRLERILKAKQRKEEMKAEQEIARLKKIREIQDKEFNETLEEHKKNKAPDHVIFQHLKQISESMKPEVYRNRERLNKPTIAIKTKKPIQTTKPKLERLKIEINDPDKKCDVKKISSVFGSLFQFLD